MKKFLPDLIAILAFIVISFIYFFPAITEDRILFQHDTRPEPEPDKKPKNIMREQVNVPAGPMHSSEVCLPTRCPRVTILPSR